eukprot:TRINITY_DN7897_c0_g1_i2.p1 TRINITY_DN7897_c0_g1~~TRINITY_DN7897_c0_g1_i2.p1  ORF type:complete len:113 (-),score=24.37 TRINITY_DN7897_c0_g1_i2:125-463(-)
MCIRDSINAEYMGGNMKRLMINVTVILFLLVPISFFLVRSILRSMCMNRIREQIQLENREYWNRRSVDISFDSSKIELRITVFQKPQGRESLSSLGTVQIGQMDLKKPLIHK